MSHTCSKLSDTSNVSVMSPGLLAAVHQTDGRSLSMISTCFGGDLLAELIRPGHNGFVLITDMLPGKHGRLKASTSTRGHSSKLTTTTTTTCQYSHVPWQAALYTYLLRLS